MTTFDQLMASKVGEQYITLTEPLIRKILNGNNGPSHSQICILDMHECRTKDWVRKLSGVKVSAKDFADLAFYRPHSHGPKKPKKKPKKVRQAAANLRQQDRTNETGTSYDSRNRILQSLGFSTYRAYLKSAAWKQAKAKALHEKGDKCLWCNNKAITAHHSRYDIETLKGTTSQFLWPICEPCHHKAEFRNNAKTGLKEANERLGISVDGRLEFPERINRGVLD